MGWKPYNEGLWISRLTADFPWCTVTGLDEMKWNEMNEMGVEKWWNEIYDGRSGRNPEKTLPRLCIVHHETHMEWPRRDLGTQAVGGERLAPQSDNHVGYCIYHSAQTPILAIRHKSFTTDDEGLDLWTVSQLAEKFITTLIRIKYRPWLSYREVVWPRIQRVRVRAPAGAIFWLMFFCSILSSTVR